MCPRAGRRSTRSGGVRWCLCCILFSLQTVTTIAYPQLGDIDATTDQRRLRDPPVDIMPTKTQYEKDLLELLSQVWTEGDSPLPSSTDKTQAHTFTTYEAKDTTHSWQQRSSVKIGTEKSSQSTLQQKLSTASNTVEDTFSTAPGSSAKANDTSSNDTGPESDENINFTSTQTAEPDDQTFDMVPESIAGTHANLSSKNVSLEPKSTENEQDSSTRAIVDKQTPLGSASLEGAAVDDSKRRTDFQLSTFRSTVQQSDETKFQVTSETSTKLTSSDTTTTESSLETKPAMGSPLATNGHRSTSSPRVNGQTKLTTLSKERESLSTTRAGGSPPIFKTLSFTSKLGMDKQLIGTTQKVEPISDESQVLDSPKGHKTLIFKTSNQRAEPGQAKVGSNAIHTPKGHKPARMSLHPKPTLGNQQGTANAFKDKQPLLRTTLAHLFHNTEHRVAKRKSTVKVRRSTRDPVDDKSTFPSSRGKSKETSELETITPGLLKNPPMPLETQKRHVPVGSEFSDYGCPFQGIDHIHHGNNILWSAGASLLVTLSGDGEALNVTWEITSQKSAAPKGTPRQARDTGSAVRQDSRAASLANDPEHLDEAGSSNTASAGILNDALDLTTADEMVNGFVVSYRIPGEEEYDSSRLRPTVRSFVLHQLHPDEDYIICVHAMAGQQRVHEECATWSKSLLQRKAVMGVLAGTLFFVPCLVVVIWIIRKDKRMRAKHGTGLDGWQTTHPGLVRAFSTCEESQEALVQEGHNSREGRYSRSSQINYSDDHSPCGSKSHQHRQYPQQKSIEQNHKDHQHHCGDHGTEQIGGDRPSLTMHAGHDSTRNLIEADASIDSEMPVLHDILEDNVFCNPTAASTNTQTILSAAGLPSSPLSKPGVSGGKDSICDREAKI